MTAVDDEESCGDDGAWTAAEREIERYYMDRKNCRTRSWEASSGMARRSLQKVSRAARLVSMKVRSRWSTRSLECLEGSLGRRSATALLPKRDDS